MNRDIAIAMFITGVFVLGAIGLSLLFYGPPPPDPLWIGGPGLEQNALIYVAMDKGFFEKNGLNVTIRDDYPTDVGPVNDLVAGKIDMSVSSEYPVIARILSGDNISIIATIDKYQNEELISRKDFGVRNLSDLKGKKIGLPRGTILEFFLSRLLEQNAMTIRDVKLVNVNTTHAPDAIANGEVYAIMYFQPYTTQIQGRLGDNAITWPGQGNQSLYGVVAARDTWIASHPDQVRRFLRSLEDARIYSLDKGIETRAGVKRHLNLSDLYLAEVWPYHRFDLSLDQSLLVAMNDEARWMVINNRTPVKTIPDFRMYISTTGLEQVKPEAVNIR